MIKKCFALAMVVAFILTTGCAMNNVPSDKDKWSIFAIKNSARGLGYAVANSKTTVDDVAVTQAYNLFRAGTMDPAKMNELISPFVKKPEYKLIYLAAFDLIEAMGGVVVNNQIMDLSKIPPELWNTVELSYLQGYEIGKIDNSKGITRAVP